MRKMKSYEQLIRRLEMLRERQDRLTKRWVQTEKDKQRYKRWIDDAAREISTLEWVLGA